MSTSKRTGPAVAAAAESKDETRRKLLLASIDVFGRYGFEGASTRLLSTTAGVNLQAIPYYFGSKKGLYLAVAEHIASRIRAQIEPLATDIRARLAQDHQSRPGIEAEEARGLLTAMLTAFARLLVSDETAAWASFIIREQQRPSAAFDRLYDDGMGRYIGTATSLVAAIVGASPEAPATRVRTIGLIGQILIFRAGRAAAMRALEWQEIGEAEFSAIRRMIQENVAALPASPRRRHGP